MPDPPPPVKNTIGSSRHPMTTPRARFQGNQLSEFPPILAQKLIARIPFGGLLVKCAGQVWGGGRPPRATPKHSATPISAWDWSLLAGTKLADGPPPKHTQGTLNPSPLKGGATTAPFRGFRDSHSHPTWTPPTQIQFSKTHHPSSGSACQGGSRVDTCDLLSDGPHAEIAEQSVHDGKQLLHDDRCDTPWQVVA